MLMSWLKKLLLAAALLRCFVPSANAQLHQQGPKLVGSGAIGFPLQGSSVALSADGNTALVGGSEDNGIGAVWVFTRLNGAWIQQGPKLVGSGWAIAAEQGTSVALSADGNTALVGGPVDENLIGAAWVFTRSGTVWSQQGAKLVGTGAILRPGGRIAQGSSVALSADGNTAVLGGPGDNGIGAVWVFVRVAGVWYQQGLKLVGSGGIGSSSQGSSVAVSADGNTILVGDPLDNSGLGATWVFTRSNGGWSQQSKLVDSSADSWTEQGYSAALSTDGNTALVGGAGWGGAAWVFTRSAGVWTQQGTKLLASDASPGYPPAFGTSVSLSADGNIALVGGPWDNAFWPYGIASATTPDSSQSTPLDIGPSSAVGAAWVFRRRGAVWSQTGDKLIGSGASNGARQGQSVALSADGATALIGGPFDNNNGFGLNPSGAAWVFTALSVSTSTVSSSQNPSVLGQAVTLTATVTAGATGTVTFTIDDVALATVPLTGSGAQFPVSSLGLGSHTITAAYSGDTNFLASTSNALTQTVIRPALALTMTSAPNPSLAGQAVTFTASLTGGTGDYVGSVQFLDGGAALGAGPVVNGQASFTSNALSPGTHTITAQYQRIWIWGSESAQGTVNQLVRGSLTLMLTSGPNPSVSGQAVTFTAILSGGTGEYAGAVQFFDGAAALGSGTVANGQAVFTTSALTVGSHATTAQYTRQWIGNTESAQGSVTQVVREPIRLSSAAAPIGSVFAPDQTVSLFNVSGLSRDVTAASLPLTTSLGGVTVIITDSAGVSRQAPLYGVFASAGQVNFVVPGDTAVGLASLTISVPGGITVSPLVNIQRVAPGIFTASANGQGVYAGQIVHAHADGTQTIESSANFDSSKNGYVANPVNFGALDDQVYLVLYGTGIRHRASDASVTATVNGVSVPALTAAQGTWPGLDQVNLALPRNLAGAGNVEIVITVEGQAANAVAVLID